MRGRGKKEGGKKETCGSKTKYRGQGKIKIKLKLKLENATTIFSLYFHNKI